MPSPLFFSFVTRERKQRTSSCKKKKKTIIIIIELRMVAFEAYKHTNIEKEKKKKRND